MKKLMGNRNGFSISTSLQRDSMASKRSLWRAFTLIAEKLYAVANFLCVAFLTLQLLTIVLMATGRYVLKNVPIWTEQFALFCLVWFSMLSVSLAVKDDSHIRMELVDYFLPERHIWIFEYFSYAVALVFSVYMIINGIFLMELSRGVQMSGMRISESYLYLSLPVAGFCTAYMALFRIVSKLSGGRHGS